MRPPSILAVDRKLGNLQLLSQLLRGAPYSLRSASDLLEFDSVLQGETKLGAALIDVTGFDPSIWDRCEELNRCGVPWAIVAPEHKYAVLQQEGLRRGARWALAKPLGIGMFLEFIRRALEESR